MQFFSLLVLFSGFLVLASTKDEGSWDVTIKRILEAKKTFEASQASNLFYPGNGGLFGVLGGFPGRFLRSGHPTVPPARFERGVGKSGLPTNSDSPTGGYRVVLPNGLLSQPLF